MELRSAQGAAVHIAAPGRLAGNGSNMTSPETKRHALIIGAGPAGLTAAYELLTRTDVVPFVLEKSTYMGGISRTVNYKGNRIDIGGHRFFSKSDRVMNWWLQFMPIADADETHEITYQRSTRRVTSTPHAGADADRVLLVRNRKSRIYFLRRFFTYPITLSKETVLKLGLWRTFRIGISYLYSMARPIRQEKNLEEFFINRFGRTLYRTFFKSYTEKVWGVPCHQISAEWGAQRIKGLSILKSLKHAVGKLWGRRSADLAQKSTETSLIERFLYPKFGPGQMWETVAKEVTARGGRIVTGAEVRRLHLDGDRITHVEIRDAATGQTTLYSGDYVFSTMPVKELIASLDAPVPANVEEVAAGLLYRDFITVGLLVDKLLVSNDSPQGKKLIDDNWIYIQEPDVQVGRLQIFNNWSPALVADLSKVWIGMEYFCYDSDPIWKLPDEEMTRLAIGELEKIGIIKAADVRDSTVLHVEKAYPAYFGAYERFAEVRQYVDSIENLFLVGRNGMHKYNNQDHSMLTAMVAVDNIAAGIVDKANLWNVNTEQDYHEESQQPQATKTVAELQTANSA
jgi:protoporphyrinogen oxidase